jgi:hypothetical protein
LDHLASGDGLQTAITFIDFTQPEDRFLPVQWVQHDGSLTLAFSARAPPVNL